MAANSPQEAIAVLIDLAQQGEINPWDVQVIDVIDRFLAELGVFDDNYAEVGENTDLAKSGQAFLWASMLVRLKADTLEQWGQDEEEGEFEEIDPELELGLARDRRLPLQLEQHIRRRASAAPTKKRKVTLQELIEQIEQIALEIGEDLPRSRPQKAARGYTRKEALRTITQLAHDENLTELATQLESFLGGNLSRFTAEQDKVELEQLLDWWIEANPVEEKETETPTTPQQQQTHARVGVFWALLLLSSQSKVELYQEEFYQELTIKPILSQEI